MHLSRIATMTCLAVLALTTAGMAAGVGVGKDKTLAAQPKANSIAELAARYDSSSCVGCHQDAHDQWSKSLHARSIFGTGRTAATFKTAIINGAMEWPASGVKSFKDVKVEHMMGCAKCHLPQLEDATDKVAQEIMTTINTWQDALRNDDEDKAAKAEKTLASLNINCLICHNRNAITHKWTDGYPKKDTVYGSKDGEHPDGKFTKMAKGQVMSESIMCGQCHGLGPNFELDNPTQCATAYGSYLFSYVPNGGNKTCQQCHMNESKLGHDMQSYRSKAMSDKAVDMKVTTNAVYWRDNTTIKPKVSVRVALTNNAGHGIPDGWPTPNRLVLSVKAKDKAGKEVFNAEKVFMPIPQQLGKGDRMGRGPYEKSGLIEDTALHPLKTQYIDYELFFPMKSEEKGGKKVSSIASETMDLEVKLWYLPFGTMDDDPFLWKEYKKTVKISTSGK